MKTSIMRAIIAGAACAGLIGAALADGAIDKIVKSVPTSAKTGGVLVRPATGRMACLSTQKRYSDAELTPLLKLLGGQIRFPIELQKGPAFNMATAGADARKAGAVVGIYLVEDPALPMTLVAMEDRWAMINVAKVASPTASQKVNAKRLQRAFSRTLKALFSSVSTVRGSRAVTSGADLDGITADPIDGQTLFNIVNGLPSVGLTPERITTYKRACEEGWAPAPTNEFQKAVWDKVHQMPSKPIKIKPETKKVKE